MGGIAATALPSDAMASSAPSLSDLARSRGLNFGCAVSHNTLRDAKYRALVLSQCDTLVGENAFKWRHLEPNEHAHTEREAQWISAFAENERRRLRAHCFLWNHHERMPGWLVDHAAMLEPNQSGELTRHIWRHGAYLARKFPQIECWDALNEAVDPSTGELRETHFTRILGKRLFDLPFRILSERLPKARLVYNDTMSWNLSDLHRNGVLRLLERALSRDLPIHALGIQSHIGKSVGRHRDELAWRRFLEEVQGMGLEVLITEFDCSDRNVIAESIQQRDATVAAHCKGYLDLTLSFVNVKEIVLWSLANKHSYMNRKSYPEHRRRSDGRDIRGHPFDHGLKPTPLFTALRESIRNAPLR